MNVDLSIYEIEVLIGAAKASNELARLDNLYPELQTAIKKLESLHHLYYDHVAADLKLD